MPGSFGQTLPATGHDEVASRHPVAAIGLDQPFLVAFDPAGGGDDGLEAGLVVQAVALADLAAELRRSAA